MLEMEIAALQKSLIFRTKSEDEIYHLLSVIKASVKTYQKNETVVTEGDPANMLGIVLSGTIEVQKIHRTGKSLSVARFSSGSTFGEAVLFSKSNVFPATVVSSEPSSVLLISKQELLKLFSIDTDIMAAFMQNMSERLVLLNQKIEILSLGTLRQRIAYFLLKEAKKQKTKRVTVPFSKRVWAEHLNSARPSLSREICFMRDQGWISFEDNEFELIDMEALEGLLS